MNLFRMDFKRNLKSLAIWTGVCAALSVLMTLLYPSMMQSDMLALLNAKVAALPKELVDALHLSGQDIRELPQFFAYMFQFVLMAACIYGATLGIAALTREESEGTIEFLYAKPLKRTQILWGKLASVCLGYLIFFFVLAVASIITCIGVKPEALSLTDMVSAVKTVLLGGVVAGFTYLFLGLAVSVFLKKPKHAASVAVMLFFITYILGSIPSITGVLEFLKWVSPLHYFVPSVVVIQGIDGWNVLICVLVMGAALALAYAVYRKKDFTV